MLRPPSRIDPRPSPLYVGGSGPVKPFRVPMTLLVLFAYAFTMELLGYALGSFLLFFYLFRFPAGKKGWVAVVLSVAVVTLNYIFFGILLKAQFPKGILNI